MRLARACASHSDCALYSAFESVFIWTSQRFDFLAVVAFMASGNDELRMRFSHGGIGMDIAFCLLFSLYRRVRVSGVAHIHLGGKHLLREGAE